MNKNYEFFKNNLSNLLAMHPGKFVVIKNEAIIGLYDSFELAYDATIKTEELGTFIIQEVVNPDDNIAHFASDKVSFSQRI